MMYESLFCKQTVSGYNVKHKTSFLLLTNRRIEINISGRTKTGRIGMLFESSIVYVCVRPRDPS
jgi:hypothetical protein